jgi:hypothetical protein
MNGARITIETTNKVAFRVHKFRLRAINSFSVDIARDAVASSEIPTAATVFYPKTLAMPR